MPRSKNGQLTQGDRMAIEQQLKDCRPLPEIARGLGVAPSTVAREIKRNGVSSSPSFLSVETRNICLRREACSKRDVCGKGCLMPCPTCRTSMCNKVCPDFLPDQCPRLAKPPFACNGCHRRYGMGCGYEYRFYDGRMAHELAQKRKVESREGIDVTPEELEAMRSIVRPLIKKGQSPEVIWATRAGELPVSPSTFYRYAEMGVFGDIIGLDLPKKVRFKPRRRRADETPIPRHDLEGRAYKDFEALPDDKKMDAVEMDCVVGRRGEAQAILTLLFRRFRFQLMLFLPKRNQEEVGKALDMVEGPIGLGEFKRLFGVILTDRGSEFLDYGAIEKSCTSRGSRCRVYYCDPMKSGQKGSCERNHVELRKVIPKGSSFAKLTPAKLSVVCSRVNSYGRPQFGGASPLQLASQVVPAELLDGLSIGLVPVEEVMMKPGLIEL